MHLARTVQYGIARACQGLTGPPQSTQVTNQATPPPAAPPRAAQVFRQDDQQLVGLLSDIRNGSPVEAHAALDQLLRACSRELDITDGILPTRLHSRNVNVDSANKRELTKLPGDTVCAPEVPMRIGALERSYLVTLLLFPQAAPCCIAIDYTPWPSWRLACCSWVV